MKDNKTENEGSDKKNKKRNPLDEFGAHVEKIAIKTAESLRKIVDKALSSRNTVLTIRVNDECNEKLNMLVEAGLFKSRSESAAFLIQEGIGVQKDIFTKITGKLKKMEKIREELKTIVINEMDKSAKESSKKTTGKKK
jgi:Arc/MetJ-type ribon-helix-helix transcriptional regulator